MRPRLPQPLQLGDFVLTAFWLAMKIVAGFVIGAALFETVGLAVGLITMAIGGQPGYLGLSQSAQEPVSPKRHYGTEGS